MCARDDECVLDGDGKAKHRIKFKAQRKCVKEKSEMIARTAHQNDRRKKTTSISRFVYFSAFIFFNVFVCFHFGCVCVWRQCSCRCCDSVSGTRSFHFLFEFSATVIKLSGEVFRWSQQDKQTHHVAKWKIPQAFSHCIDALAMIQFTFSVSMKKCRNDSFETKEVVIAGEW